MNLPFFVYGTLRPGGRHHAWALHGRTRWQQPGRMHGLTLYEGPGYPYAVCSEGGGTVHGDLVLPAEQHYAEVLRVLDHLEGCTADEPTVGYRRTVAEALLEDGSPVRARVYVAAEPLAARLLATGTPIPRRRLDRPPQPPRLTARPDTNRRPRAGRRVARLVGCDAWGQRVRLRRVGAAESAGRDARGATRGGRLASGRRPLRAASPVGVSPANPVPEGEWGHPHVPECASRTKTEAP